MTYITSDFAGIKTLWELHEYFKAVFRLPDYYGHNMDALWDCLCCSFEFPTRITRKDLSALPREMHETVETMPELFRVLESEDKQVTVVIESPDKSTDHIEESPI